MLARMLRVPADERFQLLLGVELDGQGRAWAHEQPRPDFRVGHALGSQAGDLQLLRRELVDRGLIPPPDGLPRRPRLAASELAPSREGPRTWRPRAAATRVGQTPARSSPRPALARPPPGGGHAQRPRRNRPLRRAPASPTASRRTTPPWRRGSRTPPPTARRLARGDRGPTAPVPW